MRFLRSDFVGGRFVALAFVVAAFASAIFAASHAHARLRDFSAGLPYFVIWRSFNPEFAEPGKEDRAAFIRDFIGPAPPEVPEIEFYEFDPPPHLQGRVESLVHGVTIRLPSEYDYYGYEIRRYMRAVGQANIFRNRYAIEKEIVNVEKAFVVFKYWRNALIAEMDAIEEILVSDENVTPKLKQKFHVNKAILNAFFVEMQSWLYSNEKFLKFMADNRKEYSFEGGYFIFRPGPYSDRFMKLFEAKEKAKRQMRKNYVPFGTIVY